MNESDFTDPRIQGLCNLTNVYLEQIMLEVKAYDLLGKDFDSGCEVLYHIEMEKKQTREMFYMVVDNGPIL